MRLNTEILPIIDVGLYGGNLKDIYEELPNGMREEFKKTLTEQAFLKIKDMLKEYGTVTNPEFGSPRWYNYEDDWLEFDFEECGKIEFSDEFAEFIRNESMYHSRDGFISYFPSSMEEVKECYRNGRKLEYCWAMYLYYKIKNDVEDINDDFFWEIYEDYGTVYLSGSMKICREAYNLLGEVKVGDGIIGVLYGVDLDYGCKAEVTIEDGEPVFNCTVDDGNDFYPVLNEKMEFDGEFLYCQTDTYDVTIDLEVV